MWKPLINTNTTPIIEDDQIISSKNIILTNPVSNSISSDTVGNNNPQGNVIIKSTSSNDLNESVSEVSSNAANRYKITPIGLTQPAGGFQATTNTFPNVYFNFKKIEYVDSDLIFKFTCDDLNSAGNTSTTWSCDPRIKNLTLTSVTTGALKSVKAYDKYFYQLKEEAVLKNDAISLYPTTAPAYTILVFALGNTAYYQNQDESDYNLLTSTPIIHKFASDWNLDVYNIGKKIIDGTRIPKTYYLFSGSTLNNLHYLSESGNRYVDGITLINPDSSFFNYTDTQPGYWQNFINYQRLGSANLNPIKYFNLKNMPNSATGSPSNVSIDNGSTIKDYNVFTLFFVQMHSYVDFNAKDNLDVINFETYINGLQSFNAKLPTSKKLDTNQPKNYSIRLSNSRTANSTADMFLFDYIHGNSTTVEKMKQKSDQIVQSLVYKYRNLILKNVGDFQMTRYNPNFNVQFPANIPHPYLNIYMKGS